MGRSAHGKHERQFPVFKQSVLSWYTPERWAAVYPYISGAVFSRRFIEHFITEYSRSHSCEYPLTDPFTGDVFTFNVYHAAQTVLLGVHKRHMDPFGRRNREADENGRFEFGYGEQRALVSVCALVFFRWAIKHRVMEYAREHEAAIKDDMQRLARLKRSVTVSEIEIEVPAGNALPSAMPSTMPSAMPSTMPSTMPSAMPSAMPLAMPPAMPSTAVGVVGASPLQDEYWRASIDERMQQPRKRRKRYRESTVEMIVNNQCEIKATI